MEFLNLQKAGWCTPTLIVAILGLLSIVVMTIQLIMYKPKQGEKDKRRSIIMAIVWKLVWTLGIGAILFYLCANKKIEAAWWIFGILYILPVALMFLLLAIELTKA